MSRGTRVLVAFALALMMAAHMTASTAAHVNRTVGPYTILVTLIGEPYFTTNRAGFEVWVKDDGRPINGLAGSMRAQAAAAGHTVWLGLTAMSDDGHYQAELDSNGREFDPGHGGSWTLTLSGEIEATGIDERFPVIFPAYPRVSNGGLAASAGPVATSTPPSATAGEIGQPPVALLVAGVVVTGVVIALAIGPARMKRRKRERGAPQSIAPRTGA